MLEHLAKQPEQPAGAMLVPRSLTITERLEQEKAVLELRLVEINEALSVLRDQPQIQRVIDVVTRVARY